MNKGSILGLLALCAASSVWATEMPSHEGMVKIADTAYQIVEVVVTSSHSMTETNGPNVLYLKAKYLDSIKGAMTFDEGIFGKYEEFYARDRSDIGLYISYENFSGSGIEFRTKAKDRVILFIGKDSGDGLNKIILRIEPLERMPEIRKALEQLKSKP